MDRRVAVVTGGNRGIGFEICRQLAKKGLQVVLTSRDAEKGEAAAGKLAEEGLGVVAQVLDTTAAERAKELAAWLDRRYGRLDVLVNNAGIQIDPKGARAMTLDIEVLRRSMETNAYGALIVSQALVPLMKKNRYGRIVNMSSILGQLRNMNAQTPAYRISKTALNALTRVMAAELQDTGIKVNTMTPGWVRTDMGGSSAPRSVEEGADTAVWLATLPEDGPSGEFFMDRKAIAW